MLADTVQLEIMRCIERLGSEWMDMSDARFWNETDAQARLLQLLCEGRPVLVAKEVSDSHCPGKAWDIPLAHGECLAAKKRGGLQGAFDIVVFTPESIRKYAADIRWDPYQWQKRMRELPVLAVIELKNEGEWWNDNIRKDLCKLVHRMQTDGIEHGYMVILFDAEKYPLALELAKNRLKEIRQEYSPKIRVYFFSWSRQHVQREYVDIESL